MVSAGSRSAQGTRKRPRAKHNLDAILAWAEGLLGSSVTTSDRSGSIDSSLVLRLRDARDELWFLKYPRDEERFARELRAYRMFLPAFDGEVPRLVGASKKFQCLLVSAVPGEVAKDGPRAVDPEVHRAAGAWLARLHTGTPAVPARGPEPGDQITQHRERLLVRGRDILEPAEVDFLIRTTTDLPAPAEAVFVPCHRDYSPRNWLIDDKGTLRVIDFGLTERDLALKDFGRLAHRTWPTLPHLQDAFFDGYGRPLGDADQRLLDGLVVLSVVRVMVRSFNRSDRAALMRERRLLTSLAARTTSS